MEIDFASQEPALVGRGNRTARPTERIATYRAAQQQAAQRREQCRALPVNSLNQLRAPTPHADFEMTRSSFLPLDIVPSHLSSLSPAHGSILPSYVDQGPLRFRTSALSHYPFSALPPHPGMNSQLGVVVSSSQITEDELCIADDPDTARIDPTISIEQEEGQESQTEPHDLGESSPVVINVSSTPRLVRRAPPRIGTLPTPAPVRTSPQRDVTAAVQRSGNESLMNQTSKRLPEIDFYEKIRDSKKQAKPKSGDLSRNRKRLVELAIEFFRAAIVTQDAFPDSDKADQMAPTDTKIALITARASQVCGEVKTITRDSAEWLFVLRPCTDEDSDVINTNKNIYEKLLKDSAFLYRDINDITKRGTLFENVIFGEVIRKAFFRLHSQSMGIKYAAYFNEDGGIPLVTLALVATTVHCAINEWDAGVHRNVNFTELEYGPLYRDYLSTLEGWRRYTSTRSEATKKLQQRILSNCRAGAGATIQKVHGRGPVLDMAVFEANEPL